MNAVIAATQLAVTLAAVTVTGLIVREMGADEREHKRRNEHAPGKPPRRALRALERARRQYERSHKL